MSEHLSHGWEADAADDDSVQRQFVHAVGDRVTFVAGAVDGVVHRDEAVAIGASGSPVAYDNGAVLLQPPGIADIDAVLDRVDDVFGASGSYVILSAWPLGDLTKRGLVLMGHPPFMFRPAGGAAPPVPPALEIVEVVDPDQLGDFVRSLVEGYPMPGGERTPLGDPRVLGRDLRLFVGYDGDRPVATSAAYVGRGLNDVEWVSTMPGARRRGYGEALTWAATFADPSLPAALIASDDGRPIYDRMGYFRILRMSMWWRPPPT